MKKIPILLSLFFFVPSPEFQPIKPITWHEASIFQVNVKPDKQVEKIVEEYLQDISEKGYDRNQQGVWIQSEWMTLGENRGKTPASAASLTKIATSIASLKKWDINHRFLTKFYRRGEIKGGILHGDLIIEAEGDPLFVWEEAIAVGYHLNKIGIKEIKGNLIVTNNWQMNYQNNAKQSAKLLQQALNSSDWNSSIEKSYQTMKVKVAKPKVVIKGDIITTDKIPTSSNVLFTHQSLTLREILRLMNVYSNNDIAESLGEKIGGGKEIAKIVAQVTKVAITEILLINASGLGVDNRISPHAASQMLMSLDELLVNTDLNLGDLFPVAKIDKTGTIVDRNIPIGIPSKTGTLAVVSALSGVISTVERGKVYFTIINYGNGIDSLRNSQDILLQNLDKHWQLQEIKPKKTIAVTYGEPTRNQ